jgi:hypothetical protein
MVRMSIKIFLNPLAPVRVITTKFKTLRFVLSRGFVQSLDFSAVGKAADIGKQIGEISS